MNDSVRAEAEASRRACSCITGAWERHQAELFQFLLSRLECRDDAEDLLHEIFIRLLQQGAKFCAVNQPRAWLYRTARNALIDRQRSQKAQVALPEDLPEPEQSRAPVESLDACVWNNLPQLSPGDAEIIRQCDLLGVRQKDFAARHGLSLPATKARLQRARRRLRSAIEHNCQVRFDENGRVCCHKPR